MVSFGSSSGGGSVPNPASTAIAQQFMGETSDLRTGFIDQLTEALETGGVGARIPIIARAMEGTREAGSKAMTSTAEELARSRLAGTPFGEKIMAGERRQAEIAPQNTRTQIIQQMLAQMPGFLTGTNQTIIAGAGATTGQPSSSFQAGINPCCFIFP